MTTQLDLLGGPGDPGKGPNPGGAPSGPGGRSSAPAPERAGEPERHLEEGTLQALLDGELGGALADEARAHLSACPTCQAVIRALEASATRVHSALAALDRERPVLDRGRVDVARWSVRRKASGRGWRLQRKSAAAAVLLLVVAGGAAAAFPGSPLRSLFRGGPDQGPGAMAPAALSGTDASPGAAGVAVAFREGTVSIHLEGAPPGTPVELQVVEGERVEVLAPEGARFGAGAGSVRVTFPEDLATRGGGMVDGVLVRIPAGPGEVFLDAGNRRLLRWHGGTFEFGEGIQATPRSDGVELRVP